MLKVSKSMRILTWQKRQNCLTIPLLPKWLKKDKSLWNFQLYLSLAVEKPVIQMESWHHVVAVPASYSWRGNKTQHCKSLPKEVSRQRESIWRREFQLFQMRGMNKALNCVQCYEVYTSYLITPSFQSAFSKKAEEVSPQPGAHMQLREELELSCSHFQASWCTQCCPCLLEPDIKVGGVKGDFKLLTRSKNS